MAIRLVEVFIAGCPLCDAALETVRRVACSSCSVVVHDMRIPDAEVLAKARQYGIAKVPAVVVDGTLCECCEHEPVTEDSLRTAGVGSA